MNLTVSPATFAEKPLLQRLLQLYLYDFSEFENSDVDDLGEYRYPWLEQYWSDPQRSPYIVRVDGKPAGFVLVNDQTVHSDNEWSVAEFFIARKYRRQGVGRRVARIVFDRQPGRWELQVLETNRPAQHFWRSVLDDVTHGAFQEELVAHKQMNLIVMWFDNREDVES